MPIKHQETTYKLPKTTKEPPKNRKEYYLEINFKLKCGKKPLATNCIEIVNTDKT